MLSLDVDAIGVCRLNACERCQKLSVPCLSAANMFEIKMQREIPVWLERAQQAISAPQFQATQKNHKSSLHALVTKSSPFCSFPSSQVVLNWKWCGYRARLRCTSFFGNFWFPYCSLWDLFCCFKRESMQ